MITRAQLALAVFTLALIAAIVVLVVVVVARSGRDDPAQTPHDLSRDLTAAAGRTTPTPTP